MKRHVLAALAAALLLVASSVALRAQDAAPATFQIDTVHSGIVFKVRHLGIGNNHGRFNEFDGTVRYDAANPAASSIELVVKTASVDTNNQKRDDHLRHSDYFNAREFPVLTFKSTTFEAAADGMWTVTGDLTARGTTKPITATVEFFGEITDPWGGTRVGAEATFVVKRSEFGLGGPQGLADDVHVTVSIEAVKK